MIQVLTKIDTSGTVDGNIGDLNWWLVESFYLILIRILKSVSVSVNLNFRQSNDIDLVCSVWVKPEVYGFSSSYSCLILYDEGKSMQYDSAKWISTNRCPRAHPVGSEISSEKTLPSRNRFADQLERLSSDPRDLVEILSNTPFRQTLGWILYWLREFYFLRIQWLYSIE